MELTRLLQECIDGNRISQNKLYELFAPKMFGICLRYSKHREEAEEILQEGFMQTFKSLKNFKFLGSFEGWMRQIMVRCAIQNYHNQANLCPVVSIEKAFADQKQNSDEDVVSRISRKELLTLVQGLPSAYRLVFNLYVFEGLKHREIAELLRISEGTSKSNFYDAKIILQKAVAKSLIVAKQKV